MPLAFVAFRYGTTSHLTYIFSHHSTPVRQKGIGCWSGFNGYSYIGLKGKGFAPLFLTIPLPDFLHIPRACFSHHSTPQKRPSYRSLHHFKCKIWQLVPKEHPDKPLGREGEWNGEKMKRRLRKWGSGMVRKTHGLHGFGVFHRSSGMLRKFQGLDVEW
jgi:hypothetical protein